MQYQPKPGLYEIESDGMGRQVTAPDGVEFMVSEDAFHALFEVASAPTPDEPPAPDAPADDAPADYLEVAEGANGEFYWHKQAANGRIISSSGEGFTRKFDAERAAERANPGVPLRAS
jgi:uncharacterized protein YegP (UPF0339 family)